MGDGLLGLVGATAVTVGLLLMALKLLHRLERRGVGTGRLPMAVIQRLPLGTKQGLLLVRVGRRVLVLGTSDRGPNLLTELKGEERLAALGEPAGSPAPVEPKSTDGELRRLLSRLT
ncbi:MAG: flagellar biosynthetic protein FliO, partial [Gemmatimonadetes bacterium]|nr:flagellar biosynthetic protein FliO [Gemmatimonadota bacterium]